MRRGWIEANPEESLSILTQCGLLGLSRSTFYYEPVSANPLDLEIMRILDEQYLETPFFGRMKYTEELRKRGYLINHKKVSRLMRKLNIVARVPGPHTSRGNKKHETYPYLLRNVIIDRSNQAWSTDITWVPTGEGYLYLIAIMDLFSRYVLSWRLSDNMEVDFCLEALRTALDKGKPDIFNSDQGCQFTSLAFTSMLKCSGISISMDGKGRYVDNIFIERLWRSLKYEEVYPKEYETGQEAYEGISKYIEYYNKRRLHQALKYRTPQEVYLGS